MLQPKTSQQTEAANEAERQNWNVPPDAWDAAFAWADAADAAMAHQTRAHTAPERADGAFTVWPANWATVQLFLACQTQWREAPMGGLIGLDYPGVQVALTQRTPKRRRNREFARLQAMEFAALAAQREEPAHG